jgi:branched-chain amino acid transport system permease protein
MQKPKHWGVSYFFQILVNGLHNGFLYALLAYGYVLLNQVVQRPNLAHGAFFAFSGQVLVLGATLAYNTLIFTFVSSVAFGLWASLVLSAVVLSVFASVLVPRFRNQSANMMIVATLALAIILMEAVRIGASGRDFWLPPLSAVQLNLGLGASVSLVQAINMGVIMLMLIGADGVLTMTGAGRAVRAVAQDETAAALCGINPQKVVISTAAASGLMSCAGGVLALLYFGNMSFGAGLTYGLKILFIAAAGGFSTPRMAALAAFGFGESESLWDGYLPIIWREAFFYSALAGLLVIRGNSRNHS